MSVDRNEKIWAESNTGTRMHAFVQPGTDGNLRAMCRSTIERSTGARYVGKEKAFLICSRCVKLAVALWNRAEASMEQADPYSDSFHTVDETTVLDALHAEALLIHKARTTDEPILAANEAEAIALRAERQQARRVAADANRETEKKPVAIPADMNRELLRQARAVAEAHKRLFPSDIDAAHAEALEMDAAGEALTAAHRDAMTLLEPEEKPKRWHYQAHRTTLHGRPLGVVEGYLTALDEGAVARRIGDMYRDPVRPLTRITITPA